LVIMHCMVTNEVLTLSPENHDPKPKTPRKLANLGLFQPL
jgi:hypothetical protein